jgi:hypothetical protein
VDLFDVMAGKAASEKEDPQVGACGSFALRRQAASGS